MHTYLISEYETVKTTDFSLFHTDNPDFPLNILADDSPESWTVNDDTWRTTHKVCAEVPKKQLLSLEHNQKLACFLYK